MDDVNAQLEKEIIFAMIGDFNVGKSSTINKLMGEKVASVAPTP
jgi:GTPase